MRKIIATIAAGIVLYGCAELVPEPYEPSPGHIRAEEPAAPAEAIPDLVRETVPELPEPAPPEEQEKYTVVVNEVPVNELLFALARDAHLNVDVDPRVSGVVTMNAVEQTLPQLLDRIARQVDLRYERVDDNLFITPDEPFFRSYKVNYVNMSRDSSIQVRIDTQVSSVGAAAGGATGGSSSSTEVESVSNNRFWSSLVKNVQAILEEGGAAGAGAAGGGAGGATDLPVTPNVIPHAESGILTVRATSRQHKLIQELIDHTTVNAHRQVLIQATIIEVTLNDDYQAGIDWSFLNQAGKAGFDFVSTALTGVPVGTTTSFLLNYKDPNPDRDQVISATLRLLEEFGDVSVLSSPQIMALNNQTAVLKVVDNVVYFSISVETTTGTNVTDRAVESEIHTVPVGIVLSVTPQINENDSIILQVRPTISRVSRFVNDPNPELAAANVSNPVPEIQTREMESILKMNNGQIAVLGGLMQDESRSRDTSIPGLSRLPLAGEAFKSRTRELSKSELVVFLRPLVIRNPSLEGELSQYKPYLSRGR
ncbi:MAG: pilus (MSHA type) biogenesis protein MshL [Gammaproteobacteria bacterium]|nr:pilus (MSHA type) biogenesis protein MshL [Gammaproteobacteria bacterium]